MKKKLSAVVISSSPKQLETLRGWLADSDFEVHAAHNCVEAYQECSTKPAPSLVISDVSLSDGNWYFVLKFLVDSSLGSEFVVAGAEANVPSECMLDCGVETVLGTPLDKSKTLKVVLRALLKAD